MDSVSRAMDGGGEMKTSETRSTNTGSVLSPTPRCEARAAALRYVAETVLSERREEEEEEDLCSGILSSFISNLEDRQWDSIRERMRQPLTQVHLAQVSRRIIGVVSELVFQLLVPALIERLQAHDFTEAADSKSCREETQSKDSRSSPVMVRPLVEDPLQTYFGVSQESLAKSLGSSASQSSARRRLGEEVQQVNPGLCHPSDFTSPPESSAEVTAALSFACWAPTQAGSWQDAKLFLDLATEEVISAILRSLRYCQEADMKTESSAMKILKLLAIKMRSSKSTREETERCLDEFHLDSLDDFGVGYSCCVPYIQETLQRHFRAATAREALKNIQNNETPQEANPEVTDGSARQSTAITSMTVSSEEVIKDFSCWMFRRTCLRELKESLIKSLLMFPSQSFREINTSGEPHVASLNSVASEMLDIIVNSVTRLCQPQPRMITFPWQRSENITVSEDQAASTAFVLKLNLQEIMRNFFHFYTDALDQPKEDEQGNERRALSAHLCSRSDNQAEDTQAEDNQAEDNQAEDNQAEDNQAEDNQAEDTQEGNDMHSIHSIHSTATGSRESSGESMAGVVRSFLDETEQSLKQEGSDIQTADAALTGLEELISQDKLYTFSKALADKLTSMFHQQELSLTKSLDPCRKAWSESELSKPTRRPADFITPSKQVYLFVEEAVKRLLTSLIFPPPSWRMGHMIQVQSGPSSAANWEESVKKYEATIGFYSQLMINQVMGNLTRKSAASWLRSKAGGILSMDAQGRECSPHEGLDGVTEPKKTMNIIHVFQELPNKIRKKWKILTNKEVLEV